MAELQLEVRYRPKGLRGMFLVLDSLKWVFLIAIPSVFLSCCILFLIAHGLQIDASMIAPIVDVLILVAFYSICLAFGYLVTLPVCDFHVKVSKDGITLPGMVSFLHMTPSDLLWSELKEATIFGVSGEERLVLSLDSGKRVTLSLSSFEKNELEQFLLGAELWGTNMKRSPELIDYQTALQNEMRGVERQSYTQMWEDELNRRFRSTSFLPLDPRHKLQNGRLIVVRQLAFGGLSAIYLVQRDEQDLFVLKEAVVPNNADPQIRREAEKHLARESELLFGLSHPAIAKVFDYFVEDVRTYLLLEYVNGQDLRQFIRHNGPQSASLVVDWSIELADALRYLHSCTPPVIHRDLTPDNVVLSNSGHLTVIDFGAANEFIGTATGTLIGKQAYIAPEQLRGKAVCQSDLYAFGATMYFLLTGRDPLPLTCSSPRTVVPDIPESLDTLISDLTALETVDRIKDANELITRLNGILQEL